VLGRIREKKGGENGENEGLGRTFMRKIVFLTLRSSFISI